jgi:Ca2+-binding EF-hand superfamily protein
MKKLVLGGVPAAAICAVAPAFAQAPAPAPAPQVQTFVHRMPMKTEARNDVVAHVRDMFARLDTNGDGYITRQEADAARQKMAGAMHERFRGHMTPRAGMPAGDRGAAFDRLDANHDGVITRDEFAMAQPLVREERRVVMREGRADAPRMHGMGMRMHGRMFEQADANHDGRVSLQEATNLALQHFDLGDANHDGQLTPEERMQMHQRMKAQRRPA